VAKGQFVPIVLAQRLGIDANHAGDLGFRNSAIVGRRL
jgi:hypothetical protein